MADELDLGEVLAERKQPEESVTFYLNEELQYAKSVLQERILKSTADNVDSIEAELDEVNAALEQCKYTIVLRGLPQRMREDINSKALAQFPVKPNFMGYDDSANAKQRAELENLMLLQKSIVKLVKVSTGAEKTQWTDEEVEKFNGTLSLGALKKIDESIKSLAEKVNANAIATLDPSFG